MNTILPFVFTLAYLWCFALMIIGPFQVFAALIRAISIKDWNSNFGKRLKTYFQLLIAYWVAAGIAYFIIDPLLDAEWLVYLFVPILSSALALYYWRAIFLLYKEKRAVSKENN